MTCGPDNDAPTPAEHLRRIADLMASAMAILPNVGDAMPSREKVTIAANAQWAQMQCEASAAEWGRQQAVAMAKAMPL